MFLVPQHLIPFASSNNLSCPSSTLLQSCHLRTTTATNLLFSPHRTVNPSIRHSIHPHIRPCMLSTCCSMVLSFMSIHSLAHHESPRYFTNHRPNWRKHRKYTRNSCLQCLQIPCLCLRSLTNLCLFYLDLLVGRTAVQAWSTQNTALQTTGRL